MKENSSRFVLAYISPLMQNTTAQNLGYSGERQASKNILLNMTEIETTDERLKDIMKLFHNSTHAKMHPFVTVTQWNEHWSHSAEKTSSSISGLHYGNYISHTSSIIISTVKCDIFNLAVKNGFSLERWKRGVSIMLEKSPGNCTVENYRLCCF